MITYSTKYSRTKKNTPTLERPMSPANQDGWCLARGDGEVGLWASVIPVSFESASTAKRESSTIRDRPQIANRGVNLHVQLCSPLILCELHNSIGT